MRRSASEIVKNLESRIARLEKSASEYGPVEVRVIDAINPFSNRLTDDYKTYVGDAEDLFDLFKLCERKIRASIKENLGDSVVSIEKEGYIRFSGSGHYTVFDLSMDFEFIDESNRKASDSFHYQFEIKDAGIGAVILENLNLFKGMAGF